MARKSGRKKGKSRYAASKERMKQKVREQAKNIKKIRSIEYLDLPEGFNPKDHLFYPKKQGIYKISILPYEVKIDDHPAEVRAGEIWYERTVLAHKNIGAANKTYPCPRNFGKKCPICEEANRLWDDGDDDEARELFPKKRMLMNLLIDDEIKLWETSEYVFGRELLFREITEEPGHEGFYFLESDEGFDIKLRMSDAEYKGAKYIKPTKVTFVERDEDLPESLLDDVYDLDTLFSCPSYQSLKAVFYEEDEDEKDSGVDKEEHTTTQEDDTIDINELDIKGLLKVCAKNNLKPPTKFKKKLKKLQKWVSKELNAGEETPEDSDNMCPHGHTFGDDIQEYDECEECEVWDACAEAS